MPKKRNAKKNGGGVKLGFVLFLLLALSLTSIWKADMVKEYYGRMKQLETEKRELISKNDMLRMELADVKSLKQIGKAAEQYGLTQEVAKRIFLNDPVKIEPSVDKREYAISDDFIDGMEKIVFRSGKANAANRKANK